MVIFVIYKLYLLIMKNESFLTLTAKIKKQWSMIIIITKNKQALMKLLCPKSFWNFVTYKETRRRRRKRQNTKKHKWKKPNTKWSSYSWKVKTNKYKGRNFGFLFWISISKWNKLNIYFQTFSSRLSWKIWLGLVE